MSFGKNPHLPKAQAAEQKAADAGDQRARVLAYREAAHQWDRAAARENPGKKRTEYEQHAERNRELADSDEVETEVEAEQPAEPGSGANKPGGLLN
ncbi:MAG: hypothetical protein RLZZ450_601 [Pseudomonadota bacterium]|jgi:hypothetical protein